MMSQVPNPSDVTAKLATMSNQQLAQFAQMHKNDPYMLPLASAEDARRKAIRQGAMAGGAEQPTVADQAVNEITQGAQPQQVAAAQLPEETGIAPLAAPNIQGMADGGIAGYAGGTQAFDVDAYMNNPNVQKYLAYLNAYEGRPKENHLVGYKTFDDLSDHPNQRVRFGKSKNQVSTAAGSYQILKRSWDEQKKKLGLEDFSLENQQRAAIGLLKDSGALKHVAKGEFQKANEKAKNIWASLPGSTIGEETGQRPRVKPELEAALNKKDGIERLATAPTTQPAAAQPRRVMPREEKFGLDPKLAQFFNKFMPGAEAQASELPPTSVSKLPVIPEANRSNTLSGKVNGPAATATSAPPAKIEKGMFEALKERAENASKSGILALPSMINPNIGRFLHNKEYTIPAESPSTAEIRSIETGKKETPRPERKVTVPSAAEKLVMAPVAATALATEMVAPWTGLANAGISNLLGNKKSWEQGAADMSYAPRSDAAQDALYDMHKALDILKLPPYFDVPGALPMRREKPLMSQAEQAGRVNRATDAAAALERQKIKVEGPKQGELDLGPGGSEAGAAADAALRAQQKMYQEAQIAAEAKRAQVDAARAKGAQGELFETGTNTPPVEMVNPKYERARIANDIRNEQAAEVAKTAKAGQDARLKQAATENIKAKESAAAGERQLEKQNESRRALEEVLGDNAGNRALGYSASLSSLSGLGLKGGQLPETKTYPADDSYMTSGMGDYKFDSKPSDFAPKPEAPRADTQKFPLEKKAGFEMTDEDWLNLGLGLLSGGPREGDAIQDLLAKTGKAGISALAARKEREKAALAKEHQADLREYYKALKSSPNERIFDLIKGEMSLPEDQRTNLKTWQAMNAAKATNTGQLTAADAYKMYVTQSDPNKDISGEFRKLYPSFETFLQNAPAVRGLGGMDQYADAAQIDPNTPFKLVGVR
jgi:lysozyme